MRDSRGTIQEIGESRVRYEDRLRDHRIKEADLISSHDGTLQDLAQTKTKVVEAHQQVTSAIQEIYMTKERLKKALECEQKVQSRQQPLPTQRITSLLYPVGQQNTAKIRCSRTGWPE